MFHEWIKNLAGSHLAKGVYARLPAPLRSLPASLLSSSLRRDRFGPSFHDELAQVGKRLAMSRDEWSAQQLLQLRAVLAAAKQTVPAYRARFRHIDPADIKELDDWKSVPFTDREEVRATPERFLSETVPARRRSVIATSGTTGGALQVTWDKQAVQRQHAAWWYPRFVRGYTLKSSQASFTGRQILPVDRAKPPFWIYNRTGRQWLFSCFHTDPDMLEAMCRHLAEINVDYLCGYPSFIYLVAQRYEQLGLQPPSARHVFTSSETLLPKQREVIERALHCTVVEHYGSAEGSAALVQWSDTDHHLALAQGHCFVEAAPDEQAGPARTGMLITTNLINPAMPLINYRIGDVATESPPEERPAYPAPVFDRVDGRTDDFIVDATGRRFGRLSVMMKVIHKVKEMQFYQEVEGQVEMRVVPENDFQPADEQAMLQSVRSFLGDHLKITVNYMDKIPREPSGKLRTVINRLARHGTPRS